MEITNAQSTTAEKKNARLYGYDIYNLNFQEISGDIIDDTDLDGKIIITNFETGEQTHFSGNAKYATDVDGYQIEGRWTLGKGNWFLLERCNDDGDFLPTSGNNLKVSLGGNLSKYFIIKNFDFSKRDIFQIGISLPIKLYEKDLVKIPTQPKILLRLTNGNIVGLYDHYGSECLYIQIFNPDGKPVTGQIATDLRETFSGSSITAATELQNGGFMIAHRGGQTGWYSLEVRAYNESGIQQYANILIDDSSNDSIYIPKVTLLNDGNVFLTYVHHTGSIFRIDGKIISPSC
jgi:hypothetical protein